jgi:hypothetical protein
MRNTWAYLQSILVSPERSHQGHSEKKQQSDHDQRAGFAWLCAQVVGHARIGDAR